MMSYVVLPAYLLFAFRRLLSYLHVFQQEEYDNARFLWWFVRRPAFDRKASALIVCVWLLGQAGEMALRIAPLLLCAGLVVLAVRESNPLKEAKKKLVLTSRARRILGIGACVATLMGVGLSVFGGSALLWLFAVQAIPLALVAANLSLVPFEQWVQKRYWREAHEKLQKLKPTIIGITGSFGKTSVKHILGHVLEVRGSTLITPGSVNTAMGIARIVRERLSSSHRYFVCEMGAYGPRSIARLCELAPPDIAVITAVGPAHYERFKTLDAVARTKFELVQAVFGKANGRAIVPERVLEFPDAREIIKHRRDQVIIVGSGPDADLVILSNRQTRAGTEAEIAWKGSNYILKAPLYGEHQGLNLALAFAAAVTMDVPGEDVVALLESTAQIEHRLEVKRESSGVVVIDDAYNSNPVGFASGLSTLSLMCATDGRRVLVTPGMVELGVAHDEEHRKIGALAARHVDILIPIAPTRIAALVGAFVAGNPAGTVVPCESFAEARAWLSQHIRSGDAILIENDLPDLYERKPAF